MTNPQDPTPAYLQIANALRAAIVQGEYADGDQLPSLPQLTARYKTAAGTVRQAIGQLQSEGLVISRQGRGVFVRKPRRLRRVGSTRHLRSQRPAGAAPLEAEAEAQDINRRTEVIDVFTATTPDIVAQALDAPVVVRRYLMYLDDEPAQTATSYIPLALAESTALMRRAPVSGGTHALLAERLGTPLTHAAEDLVARMPTPDEARELRLPPGTPVVELVRTIYAAERPVEVSVFVFAGDRHTFAYTVPFD